MKEMQMKQLTEQIGDAFYVLESKQFRLNYLNLKD